jgi:dTDP-4-amino-4,6-dideoxygalactose transaminase
MGHMACFSFFPSKNLGGIGDGGMVTTNDDSLAAKLRLLRNHGHHPKYFNKLIGGNFRLDAIQAAVLRVKLKYLDGWTEARQRNARRYRELFAAHGLALGGPVTLPAEAPDRRHIYNQFVIRAKRRDALMAHLKEKQIGTEIYYPLPLHLQECYSFLEYAEGDFPASERAAKDSVAVPIYPELDDDELHTVVAAIDAFYG